MNAPSLLMVCGQAFAAVMAVLAALAGAMRLLLMVLPDRTPRDDAAVAAAIRQAVQQAWPGCSVARIEEIR